MQTKHVKSQKLHKFMDIKDLNVTKATYVNFKGRGGHPGVHVRFCLFLLENTYRYKKTSFSYSFMDFLNRFSEKRYFLTKHIIALTLFYMEEEGA